MTLTTTAPYGSPEPITRVLDRYRETGLGGGPLTNSLLQKLQLGQEVARRVLLSLKELELIADDGMPTVTLLAFEKAPSSEYKSVLANHLLDYYAPIFAVLGKDVSKWTPEQIDDQFRELKPKTLRGRMAACFLGLCEYAGIVDLKSAPLKRPGPKTSQARAPRDARSSKPVAPRIKRDFAAITDDDVSEPISIRGASETLTLNLSSGGVLAVALSGRVADLNSSERNFVFELFDAVKGFSERKALNAGPAIGMAPQVGGIDLAAQEGLAQIFK